MDSKVTLSDEYGNTFPLKEWNSYPTCWQPNFDDIYRQRPYFRLLYYRIRKAAHKAVARGWWTLDMLKELSDQEKLFADISPECSTLTEPRIAKLNKMAQKRGYDDVAHVLEPKLKKRKPEEDSSPKELYISNLPVNTTEKELREFFKGCGGISRVKTLFNYMGGCRGYGFINFHDHNATTAALKKSGEIFKTRTINVCYSNS